MKIYEKENFKDLPDYFWEYWLKKIKEEIINTSYPLFLIRVGICDKNEEIELYHKLHDMRKVFNDSTFFHEWYKDDKYIGIQINTIFDYANISADDMYNSMTNIK